MSKYSRQALTFLVISALGVSTAVSVAQTSDGATAAPAAPAVSSDDAPRLTRAHTERRDRRGRRTGQLMRFFDEVDADNSGSVTQDEVDKFLADQLTKGDTDGDGAVGLDEFQVIYLERTRPRMVDAFQGLDDDGDGQITSAELSDRFGTLVERMDRNGDEALSREDRRGRGERGRRGRRGDRR